MNFLKYARDRIFSYCIWLAALASSIIFLSAFNIDKQAIGVIAAIFVSGLLINEIWDFLRKKDFYDQMKKSSDELDKKYLLPETLQEPKFYEGKLMFDALLSCSRSMSGHVALYRRKNLEFREYIELWVHEAKIPVASLQLMCRNNACSGEKMLTQLKRVDDDIENVLYYARSENPEKDYIVKDVMLQRAFSNVAVKNKDALNSINAEIRTSNLNTYVLTDGKWLEFILGQLMANSIKYVKEGRPLKLNVYAESLKDKTVLRFRDNGAGIPKEDIPYVFEKSFTGQNGRKGRQSTGMGLYIVKKLCGQLGHEIKIYSEQGEYTEVAIAFLKNDFYRID